MDKILLFAAVLLLPFAPVSAENRGPLSPALRQLAAGKALPKTASPDRPKTPGGGVITLYVYPPSNTIDWSTPKTALNTFIPTLAAEALDSGPEVEVTSSFGETAAVSVNYRSSMGHTIAHVGCVLPGGKEYDSWTSFSGQDFREVDKGLVFDKKVGLGALFHDYIDGHIISGAENTARLFYYKGKNGKTPRYLSQRIDAAACGRVRDMVEFFKSFHYPKDSTLQDLQKRPPHRVLYFTSNLDPYESYRKRTATGKGRVGGGCAPYGLALLKAAGKYDKALDPAFTLRLRISERLIGGIPDGGGGTRTVTLADLLGPLGDSWTWPGYRNREFRNYDPYKIWKFIGEARSCLLSARGCGPEAGEWLARNKGLVAAGEPLELDNTVSKVRIDGIAVK